MSAPQRRAPWPPVGIGLLVVALVLGSPWLLILALLVLSAGVVAAGWARGALAAASYTRALSEGRVFAGETVELSLTLCNDKLLPLAWLRVSDLVPDALELEGRELSPSSRARLLRLVHLTALRPYETVRWRYPVRCPRRGIYRLGPARLASGDVFGLYDVEAEATTTTTLVVYPVVRPLPEFGFPAGEPFGGRRSRERVYHDPLRPIGVRDYLPGDRRRRVDWKATARYQALKTRVLEPVSQAATVIVLNVATFEREWIGIDPEQQERAIALAASIADHAVRHGHAVGLVANGSVPGARRPIRVPTGRSPDALPRVLEALAAVSAFVDAPIERLLAAESRRAPRGATLVTVTSVVRPKLEAELLRLSAAGRRVALVSLDLAYDGAPPGVTVHRLDPAVVDAARWSGRSAGS